MKSNIYYLFLALMALLLMSCEEAPRTEKVSEEDLEMLKSLGFFPSEDESGFYSFRFGSL